MPGHSEYMAAVIVSFNSPGHEHAEDAEKLGKALENALNALAKDGKIRFKAAHEHEVVDVKVAAVGATLGAVRKALGKPPLP